MQVNGYYLSIQSQKFRIILSSFQDTWIGIKTFVGWALTVTRILLPRSINGYPEKIKNHMQSCKLRTFNSSIPFRHQLKKKIFIEQRLYAILTQSKF